MPIRRSPNGAHHPVHSLVAIARNGWSRSIGTTGRNQSEQVVAITRCAQIGQLSQEKDVDVALKTTVLANAWVVAKRRKRRCDSAARQEALLSDGAGQHVVDPFLEDALTNKGIRTPPQGVPFERRLSYPRHGWSSFQKSARGDRFVDTVVGEA